jgi:hypothetical protein
VVKIIPKKIKHIPTDNCYNGKCDLYDISCKKSDLAIPYTCWAVFEYVDKDVIAEEAKNQALSNVDISVKDYLKLIENCVTSSLKREFYKFFIENLNGFSEHELLERFSNEGAFYTISTKAFEKAKTKYFRPPEKYLDIPVFMQEHINWVITKKEWFINNNSYILEKYSKGEKITEDEKADLDECLGELNTSRKILEEKGARMLKSPNRTRSKKS